MLFLLLQILLKVQVKKNKHFIQFLENSLGSAFEWETQLIICFRQGFIKEKTCVELQNDVQKIQSKISNFIDALGDKN